MTNKPDLTNPTGIAWLFQPQEWQDALRAHADAGGEVEYLDIHLGNWQGDYAFAPDIYPGIAYRAVLPPVTYDPEAVEALVKAADTITNGAWRNSEAIRAALPMGALDALDAALSKIKGGAK